MYVNRSRCGRNFLSYFLLFVVSLGFSNLAFSDWVTHGVSMCGNSPNYIGCLDGSWTASAAPGCPYRANKISDGSCSSSDGRYLCQYFSDGFGGCGDPCPTGYSFNAYSNQCENSSGCNPDQTTYMGSCADNNDCGNGTTVVHISGGTDPAYCVGTDGSECSPGQVFLLPDEVCINPDSSSSSSDSSSSSSSESSSDSSSSDSSDSSDSSGSDSSGGSGSDSSGGSGSGSSGSNSSNNNSANESGDCSSEPSCEGDAIACAQLKQLWKNECGKTVSNEGSCTETIECNGDAISCAILRRQQAQACALQVDKVGNDIDAQASAMGLEGSEELQELDVDLQSVAGNFLDDNTPLPPKGSCIPPGELTLSTGTVYYSYQPQCDIAEGMQPWVIVAATVFGSLAFLYIAFVRT